MNKKPILIVIGGPTASGKTSMAINLAQRLHCEIVSADSRQVYKEMSIGTAKPSENELSLVKHHLISNVYIHDDYNAGIYEIDALEILNKLFFDNKYAILVGGTGLYINAVCHGLDDFPDITDEVRTYYQDLWKKEGIDFLLEMLKQKDPEYFEIVDKSNPRRITRALEVMHNSTKKYSEQRAKISKERPFEIKRFLLDVDRTVLYERINQRVLKMVSDGLVEEVASLLQYQKLKATQTVGYQEFFKYFKNEISLEAAIALVQQNSRRYAKRQMTWFNNQSDPWKKIENIGEILIELDS
ncbi:MAG: tRNA (adenosine(37)-N6)-dimethylallyltransferase MiaA [Saprospiraceae bacterium]|nr:tRNA (adenosine(37)-N6)-dimethylallyltransferase MiaA [Saprospiraceae bacterium]